MSFEIALDHRVGERHVVLDLVSDAPVTALVGVSGAGKTTVLDIVAGLTRPDHGRVAVGGEVLLDRAAGIDLPPEKRRAGYVFQDTRLFPHRTVAANLAYGEKLAKGRAPLIDRAELLDLLGIADLLGRWPATLSGGETRRVALGRALLATPRFLLLDEPMSSLDPARAEGIRRLIADIAERVRLPMLLVSHDRAEVDRLAGAVFELATPGGG